VREDAILRTTLELLAECGYDQLTIDAVAARARCSKATIYRRWPGKAALVMTAVRRHAGQPATAAPDTGSLRSDLLAALEIMRSSLSGQDAALVLGLLIAMHRDQELAAEVRVQVLNAKREVFGAVIARAIARGEVPATCTWGARVYPISTNSWSCAGDAMMTISASSLPVAGE